MQKFTLSTMLVFMAFCAKAQIYVTEHGGSTLQDGASWQTAYDKSQLQQAINEAETAPLAQVWVAAGTYKPTESLSSSGLLANGSAVSTRDNAFILKKGVEIYGGFTGTETTVAARVVRPDGTMQNETILSGDLNDNGIADDGDSYHVVASRNNSAGAVLDGFTIRFGFANGAGSILENGVEISQNKGAAIAMHGDHTAATFRNLQIVNHAATSFGGAVSLEIGGDDNICVFQNVHFAHNTSAKSGGAIDLQTLTGFPKVTITGSTFKNNEGDGISAGDGGGALFFTAHDAGVTLDIAHSLFEENSHNTYGGAIRLNGGTANITSTIFKKGYSRIRGGAVYSTANGSVISSVNIDSCTFTENHSDASAGHYYLFAGNLNIENSIFEKGTTNTSAGGAMVLNINAHVNISSSSFIENKTGLSGGAIYSTAQTLNIARTRFYSNEAASYGGGLYLFTGSENDADVKIWNSVFYDNISRTTIASAAWGGGAIYQTRTAQTDPEKHTPVSTVTAINNTFYANKSINANAAAYMFNSTADVRFNLYNNIFYGNLSSYDEATNTGTATDIRLATASIQHHKNNLFVSAISTSGSRTVENTHILSDPPELLFHSTNPSEHGFLFPAMKPLSPENSFALDKGDSDLYANSIADPQADFDLAGAVRVSGDQIDLGAYEVSAELLDILPVLISSFEAVANGTQVALSWNADMEENLLRYEIERSVNGTTFEKVAEVAAEGLRTYRAIDYTPVNGVNFYRLKMTDRDGSQSYFHKIVRVYTEASAKAIQVFPNPVTTREVKLSFKGIKEGNYPYSLVNASGKVVQQGTINYTGAPVTLPLSNAVSNGMHALRMAVADGLITVQFMKQ